MSYASILAAQKQNYMNISLIGWSHLGSLIVKNLRQPWHRKRIRWVSQFIYQTFKFWRDRDAIVFFICWTKIWGMLHGRVKKHQWWRFWYSYSVKWWFPSESKFASFSSFVHISYSPPLCSLPHSHYLLLLSKGRKRGPENRTLSHNFNFISTLTFRLLLNKDVGTKY